ncbi:MAG: hypothetical protein ACXAAI_05290 [Promethearchaeota archaeon]|jgi:hypothetical protein
MIKIYGVNRGNIQSKKTKNDNLDAQKYNCLMFIHDLKKEVQRVKKTKITNKVLSLLISNNEKLITYAKKNYARIPNYQISLQELSNYKANLRKNLKKLSINSILLIEKYIRLNNPRKGPNKIYKFHPRFNLHYFKDINTKEKAYWLGFIYADGSISYKAGRKRKHNRNLRFRFGLNAKDTDSINAVDFLAKNLGLESKFVNIKTNGLYGFEIVSDELVNHLVRHGLIIGKRKTYQIELPPLISYELLLAFLLGFFDGDGKTGSTRITSSSLKFLIQIRDKFNLPYTIYHEPGKNAWSLHLGAVLFNAMLDNYERSMPKKRVKFVTPKQLRERNTKLRVTPKILKEIQRLLLIIPIKELCTYYGISASRLGQISKEKGLVLPPRGYWHTNKRIGISPLLLEGV